MGRTATSRSAGAIEGAEVQAPRPRYVRRVPTIADALLCHLDRRFAMPAVTVVTFTAIPESCRRGRWCPSPRSVVTTYAAINTMTPYESLSASPRRCAAAKCGHRGEYDRSSAPVMTISSCFF
jgi:hypothetical protein